jgi:hypothetical protein
VRVLLKELGLLAGKCGEWVSAGTGRGAVGVTFKSGGEVGDLRFSSPFQRLGVTASVKISEYSIRMAKAGIGDIIGCSPTGRFIAIEVKVKGNEPTPEQLEFLDAVHRNYGGSLFH